MEKFSNRLRGFYRAQKGTGNNRFHTNARHSLGNERNLFLSHFRHHSISTTKDTVGVAVTFPVPHEIDVFLHIGLYSITNTVLLPSLQLWKYEYPARRRKRF